MQRPTWIFPTVITDTRFNRTGESWDLSQFWLKYNDVASINGVPSFRITLQGLSYKNGIRSKAWSDLFREFDLVFVEGQVGDGTNYTRKTLQVGLIIDIQEEQSLTNAYEYNTVLVCENFQTILARDAIAYWWAYGAVESVQRARVDLPENDLSGELGLIFKKYFEKVGFNSFIWNKNGKNLGDFLSFNLLGLPAYGTYAVNLNIDEGTHWGLLSRYIDAPLHEFYTRTLNSQEITRPNRVEATGFNHIASQLYGKDYSSTTLVLRPAPFPHAEPGGTVNFNYWNTLRLWDYRNSSVKPYKGKSLNRGLGNGMFNVFMVQPRYWRFDEKTQFQNGLVIVNSESLKTLGYSPLRISTGLLYNPDNFSDSQILENMTKLCWRMAGQHNKLEQSLAGSITVPFDPEISHGERILFNGRYGDKSIPLQAYIQARAHTVDRDGEGATNLTISRAYDPALYEDSSYFAEGLEEALANYEGS